MVAASPAPAEGKPAHQRDLQRRARLAALLIGPILVCEYFILTDYETGSFGFWFVVVSFPLFPLLAAVRSWLVASGSTGLDRGAWQLIALSCLFMAATEGYWVYLEFSPGEGTPFTALTTVGYVFSPILLLLGMAAYQNRVRIPGASMVQASNLGIVFSAVVFVYLLSVYQALPEVSTEPGVAMLKTLQGAIVMAATVTGFALALQTHEGHKRAIISLLAVGMLCIVIEYFTFLSLVAIPGSSGSDPFEVLYLMASALWFVAASEQAHLEAPVENLETLAGQEERRKQGETLIPAAAVASVFIAAVVFRAGVNQDVLPYLVVALCLLVSSLALRDWWAQKVEANLNDQLRSQADFLVEARDAAEASDAAKSRFLSWVSHETRTPLSGILGFTELLEDPHSGELNEDQTDFVKSIRESGNHLLDLINDLLDVTKITMGAIDLSLEDVATDELVHEVVQNVELGAHKGITIVNEMGADAPTLRVDRRRFRQSLYNLLSNALKFTPAGRSVGIRWSIERPGWICIEVWDQGIGIAEKHMDLIFDEFYQVDRKRDEALGGSGIGLALTRRLANLHGGEVRVKSQTGFGSRFFLVMPISSVQAVPERGASEGAGAAASSESDMDSGARILVVDDDSPNLAVIRGFLRVRGIDPLVARSGEEAVEMVGRERPHLVFMDIHMPGCDGFEALARIRENSSLAEIPILAMTASASESDRARYEAAGFDGFLPKPIDSAKLDGYLAELAERLEQAAARPVA